MNNPNASGRLEKRVGWGMASESVAHVVYPESVADVRQAMLEAKTLGMHLYCWGNGRSYGDAALNDGGMLLDLSRMNRVLDWSPESGLIQIQPGMTIEQLWQHCLSDGYWPPVVSGTQTTTLGGCVSANAHGKNNWKYGPIGDHVLSLEVVLPDGRVVVTSREEDPDLFHGIIGGFGLLGVVTSITLQMKRVYSGRIKVMAESCDNLAAMFEGFERYLSADSDYVVGWIDAFPRGGKLGRGQIHAANYAAEGEDPKGLQLLNPADQKPGPNAFGVVPRKWMWFLATPLAHRLGMRFVNWGRSTWAQFFAKKTSHFEPHAQFNFLLDFVPNWKWIYRPGGLIQYQLFLPASEAQATMRKALELQQQLRLESWLVVMKRHREDTFWLSHGLDGYSFAMDFPVTDRNRERLFQMTRKLEDLVLEAGGKFYLAKDSVTSSRAFRESLGADIIDRFIALKRRVDPDARLQGNVYRRLFGCGQ